MSIPGEPTTGESAGFWGDGMAIFRQSSMTYASFVQRRPVVLTTCGAVGRLGPSDASCRAAYDSETLRFYQGATNGIQSIRINVSGTYQIAAIVSVTVQYDKSLSFFPLIPPRTGCTQWSGIH
jgi:hypothetical protein